MKQHQHSSSGEKRASGALPLRLIIRSSLLFFIFLALVAGIVPGFHKLTHAYADTTTVANDQLRTGWYSNQTNLSPDLVSGGTFGKLFAANVDGQVYAQPLVSQGTLLIVTETNNIYGLDPVTGAQKWTRNLGVPFNPSAVSCSDLAPSVGITGTPVIDPLTNIAYFTSKTYVGGSTSGPVAWYMHAVDVATGNEESGFPVQIQGTATNDTSHPFDSTTQMQRPGLLLMNGVIYAAFGGHCDRKPYEGWVIGVSTAGQITTLWSDEAGVPQTDAMGPGGGIWTPGGGLLSDGDKQIIFSSGNGEVPPSQTAGKMPPGTLGQTVTRLMVQSDGSLKATDFFSPYDADVLNSNDSDLGSGAPIELPSPYFGTPTYPHIVLQDGKQGNLFVLNADNLGGRGEGPNNSDAIINRVGPYGGLWSKPSVWPGDGGYIYMTTAQGGGGTGKLKALKYGLDGNGKPIFNLVGTSSDTFGYGSSTPIITSSGTTSGSALIWTIWEADGTGSGGQLRAYDPVPVNGTLNLRYSISIGTASKFNSPGIDNNRIYVGTRDGHVLGFGSPVTSPVTGSPLDLGTVVVGSNATGNFQLTANQNLTVTTLALDNAAFRAGTPTPTLPATLTTNQTISIPITFTPTAAGLVGANLTVTTSVGTMSFSVSGTGQAAAGTISASPTPISFGGMAAGGQPIITTTTFSNVGATAITVTGETLPSAPFSVTSMPAINSTIAPNASITVTITFAPTAVGSYSDNLTLNTTGGTTTVPMTGTAGAPGHMTISSTNIDVGDVPIGGNGVASFTVSNTGGSPISITRSKSPIAGVGFAEYNDLPEGSVIAPGGSVNLIVLFTPTTTGVATDAWSLNSDDGNGVQSVNFTGTGIAAVANPVLPSLSITGTNVAQPTSGTSVITVPVTLNKASTSTITLQYTTKDGTATVGNEDYQATTGTLTFNPGDTSKTIQVTVNGRLTYGPATTFTVNLFKPVNATLASASGKITLEPVSGNYSMYIGDTAVNASAGGTVTANVPVTLSPAPIIGQSVTVSITTLDGTAKAGTDYVAVGATKLTFSPGVSTLTVPVTIDAATAGAGNKAFTLRLSAPSSNATIADAMATVTIVNGGAAPLPTVYVSDLALQRPTSGTANATFTLTLDKPSTSPISVNYATHDGTATVSNGQYIPAGGSVTFNPGDTSTTVSVTVKGDGTHESDVYFYLNLTQATNAVIGDGSGRATLINQNGRYLISPTDTTGFQNSTSQSMVLIPISLNVPVATAQTVLVQFSTADGTALAGTDYVAQTSTQITFNVGQQTILVPILIQPNANVASPKTLTLTIATTSSNVATAQDTSATITIVNHG
jgi:hypothetical protein